MKRNPADAEFSNLIREAYDWTCCRCGKYFPEGNRQGLHASHIYSRRHQLLRCHPLNVVAHCFSCHQWFGGNPIEGGVWAMEYLGEGVIKILRDRLREIRKYTKADKEEMRQHYKEEMARIKKLRKEGATGILKVTPYD